MKRWIAYLLAAVLLAVSVPALAYSPTPSPSPTPTPSPTPIFALPGARFMLEVDGETIRIPEYIQYGNANGMYVDGIPPQYLLWEERIPQLRIQPGTAVQACADIAGMDRGVSLSYLRVDEQGRVVSEPISDGISSLAEGAWPIVMHSSYGSDAMYCSYFGVFWLLVGEEASVPSRSAFFG